MTTHQLFIRHAPALGIDSHNTFCKLLELLDAPAKVEFWDEFGSAGWELSQYPVNCVFEQIFVCAEEWRRYQNRVRVTLLDGTVIKEWGSQ